MANIIKVKGAGKDRKIVLWETDPAHPNGEVVVSNDGEFHEVGETAAVKRLIGEGLLVTQAAPVSRQQTPPVTPPKPAPPWDGYDTLSAEDVIARLPELDNAGRAAVLAYEQSKGDRGRKTIINAAAPSPAG
jgi:hypothetical protein